MNKVASETAPICQALIGCAQLIKHSHVGLVVRWSASLRDQQTPLPPARRRKRRSCHHPRRWGLGFCKHLFSTIPTNCSSTAISAVAVACCWSALRAEGNRPCRCRPRCAGASGGSFSASIRRVRSSPNDEPVLVGVNEIARSDLATKDLEFAVPLHGFYMRVTHAQPTSEGLEARIGHLAHIGGEANLVCRSSLRRGIPARSV